MSLRCSSTISLCKRVLACEELVSDKLEEAESDIVKISTPCSVLRMAGALNMESAFKKGTLILAYVGCRELVEA